jgi:ribosomal-protein-alanine N-acetyltransferase
MIDTLRLRLREFVEDDFAALREIEADPEVLRYRSRKVILETATREFLQICQRLSLEQPRSQYPWAIILCSEDRLIGQIGLTLLPPGFHDAYLWYSLNRRYWGNGYMTEAIGAVVDFSFRQLDLLSQHAHCQVDNQASWRVLEKAGFLRIEQSHIDEKTGSTSAEFHYALTRAEWKRSV